MLVRLHCALLGGCALASAPPEPVHVVTLDEGSCAQVPVGIAPDARASRETSPTRDDAAVAVHEPGATCDAETARALGIQSFPGGEARVRLEGPGEVTPNFRWLVPPLVRVCSGADLSLDEVRAALDFWGARGLRYRTVVRADCTFAADGTPLSDDATLPAFNTITVTRLGQLAAQGCAGQARWAACGDIPLWAVTLLPRGALDQLALRHELGHAFGFPHVERGGHVMNPRREAMGESTAGLGLAPVTP